jgi:hypothetical protein
MEIKTVLRRAQDCSQQVVEAALAQALQTVIVWRTGVIHPLWLCRILIGNSL